MNLVDSSGWIAYFSNNKNASFFAKPLEDARRLVIPAVCFYEVFKKLLMEKDQELALQAVGVMQKGLVVDLTPSLSMEAAKISCAHKLAMADSIILATARAHKAVLWTQDAHFKAFPNVKYVEV